MVGAAIQAIVVYLVGQDIQAIQVYRVGRGIVEFRGGLDTQVVVLVVTPVGLVYPDGQDLVVIQVSPDGLDILAIVVFLDGVAIVDILVQEFPVILVGVV